MVKEKRIEAGLSQNQLSKIANVPQGVISDIENGNTKSPRIDTLMKIAEALDVTVADLIGEKKAG